MKWEEYYDRFWDWAESTKISRISLLTDFTSSAEVVEIANEFFDEKIGSRLVKRALDQGIRFSPSEIIELGSCVTDDVFYEAIRYRQGRFTTEQYAELEGLCCDEDLLDAVARKDGIRREMDGVIVIPRTHPLSWIMMFYALPKEMFENLPEYRQLPRNMRDIQVSEKYMRMINCDDFLIMIWSLYAWMVWHCLRVSGKNGEYRPIPGAWGHYSEDFPIWRMTYEIGMHFREVFEHYSNWKVQRLFNLKKDEEIDSSDSYPSSAHRAIMSSPPFASLGRRRGSYTRRQQKEKTNFSNSSPGCRVHA